MELSVRMVLIKTRAVKMNGLIYAIIVTEINVKKYLNATLFTSGVR